MPIRDSGLIKASKRRAFIVSPQPWGGFKVSKHHYAAALARHGWEVFFIDPPLCFQRRRVIASHPTDVSGVTQVEYSLPLPAWTKFKARPIFNLAMRYQARRLSAQFGRPDLVWDFDNAYQFSDLRHFLGVTTIFHLVDRGIPGLGDKAAKHKFHLHESFCRNAGYDPATSSQIGHGVSADYVNHCPPIQPRVIGPDTICMGLVANLSAKWIDWQALAGIARRYPRARFVLWGPHDEPGKASAAFAEIMSSPQFEFRGIATPMQIALASEEIDVWLLPFITTSVPGGAINSHKVLEYLATGKPVIMSYLEAYVGNTFVRMVPDGAAANFADAVIDCVEELRSGESVAVMQARREYALARTYEQRLAQVFACASLAS